LTNKEIISKEIHLGKRPTGFITEDDFLACWSKGSWNNKEGKYLVRNMWISIDPFMRIYMVKGSKLRLPIELNKAIDGGLDGRSLIQGLQKIYTL
jgi:NADPH-dependent curcumin reductase CurA